MKSNKQKNRKNALSNGLLLVFLAAVLTIPTSWASELTKMTPGAVIQVPVADIAIPVEWLDTIGVDEWMRAGLSRSAPVRQSEARTQQAEARAGEARAEMLPMLSLRHAKGRETSTGTGRERDRHTTSSEAIRLTQNVFNAPAMLEWASANRQLSAAQWRQVARQQQDAQQLAQAVIDMTSALRVLEHAQHNMQELEGLLKYIDARTSAGLG